MREIFLIFFFLENWNNFLYLVDLLLVSHGTISGWLSPALLLLTSEDTPLSSGPLTPSEISWVVSIPALGNLVGTAVFHKIATHYGNRVGMLLLGIPQIVSFLIFLRI